MWGHICAKTTHVIVIRFLIYFQTPCIHNRWKTTFIDNLLRLLKNFFDSFSYGPIGLNYESSLACERFNRVMQFYIKSKVSGLSSIFVIDDVAGAHLRLECFQETIYFGSKGSFHVTSRLLWGRLLLFVYYLWFSSVYKQINQSKVMLGSSQDSKLKIFALTWNSWSLGNIHLISQG